MKNDATLIKFILPEIVPSIGFAVILFLITRPIIPLRYQWYPYVPLISSVTLVILVVILISALLRMGKPIIYKLFSGDFLRSFPFFFYRQRKMALQLKQRITELEASIEKSDDLSIGVQRYEYYYLISLYEQIYPQDLNLLAPTRLGNILLSYKNYPQERYGLDPQKAWDFMKNVIPLDFSREMSQQKAKFDFFVNSSLLLFGLSFLALLLCLFQFYVWQVSNNERNFMLKNSYDSSEFFDETLTMSGSETRIIFDYIPVKITLNAQRTYFTLAVIYSILWIVFYSSAVMLYRSSLTAGRQYGNYFRASFDLFRNRLLVALGIKMPNNLIEERAAWGIANEFINSLKAWELVTYNYQIKNVTNLDQQIGAYNQIAGTDITLTQLKSILSSHFNLEELKNICFDLSINYEDLPGEQRDAKARELVLYCQRVNRLDELIEHLRGLRPNIPYL